MKHLYNYLRSIGLSLFLILFVTLPIIYYLGVFSQDEGMRFQNYTYFTASEEMDSALSDKELFDKEAYQAIDLGVLEEYVYVRVDLDEIEGINQDSLYIIEISNPSFREVELIRFDATGGIASRNSAGTGLSETNPLKNPNPFLELYPAKLIVLPWSSKFDPEFPLNLMFRSLQMFRFFRITVCG